MLRDVFYFGDKPNAHPRERFANSLEEAKRLSTTEHFWIINEFCDYRHFDWDWDFEFLADEDVWAEDHNNVWPSYYQKDSGTWLCSTNKDAYTVYRADVDPLHRKHGISKHWKITNNIDKINFDFKWHPDPTDPPYIYQFGTQWQRTGGPQYIVDGATEVKYMTTLIATAVPDMARWKMSQALDASNFDFSWHPDESEDELYVYQFCTQWQKTGGPKYIPLGASDTSPVKYMDIMKTLSLPNKHNFNVIGNLNIKDFDYSWHPDETEEPFIYVFGNNYYPAEIMPTIEYKVSGATQTKYINDIVATLGPDKNNWVVVQEVNEDKFDYSWKPNPKDPPYIYIWGNKYIDGKIKSTIEYHVPGATDYKYMTELIDVAPQWDRWIIPDDIDKNSFDFSWRPDPTDEDFIWQFGTQHQKTGGPRYLVPGATEIKYNDTLRSIRLADIDNPSWKNNIKIESFDYSWHPDGTEEPFIYVFGNQWNDAVLEPTVEYHMPGATQRKYITNIVATVAQDRTKWEIINDVENFDYSWRPNPTSPPYIYQFGTLLDKEDGPRYITPGNDGEIVYLERKEVVVEELEFKKYYVETTLEDLIKQHPNEIFWALNPDLDYSDFDFDWRPSIEQSQYVHAFGSSESETTQTYLVNSSMWEKGYRELNWVVDEKLDEQTLAKLFKKPDMFFVDRGNKESQERFDILKQQFPTIQKTRYLNSWVDTISRCLNRTTTNLCWILNSELDYSAFDFDYYPNPWQMRMVHVFGTQYSHWGTTFMVNKESFDEDTKYIKIIEHLSMLNFVKNRKATVVNCLYDMYVIDHGNSDTDNIVEQLKPKITGKNINTIKYRESYLETFRDLLKMIPDRKEHYIWVTSSICDYSNFDFKYICDPFARDQLHVFPSEKQKFGDTFLVDVNRLRMLIEDMDILEDYKKVNFNQHMRVKRLPAPVIISNGDTHVDSINSEFNFPYAVFQTIDNKELEVIDTEPMSVWDEKHKNIIITTTGGTRIIAPKEVKNYVKKELYDYPYIIKNFRQVESQPLDIVFLSNGETGADENYEHLLKVTKGLRNRVVRVDGVNGRVAAYHAAAEASNTSWMFTVFAKLRVNKNFDWSWQPDRLQVPKHYIFHATNPVNKLEYGHQAMIAYNKCITLANTGTGLDFTLDNEHEVVEVNSGVAMYNTDAWTTWRTAFREALKLRADTSQISKDRLHAWLTIGNGDFAEYSINGAKDAVEYYDEVNGDLAKLRLSYDWPWLKALFDKKTG